MMRGLILLPCVFLAALSAAHPQPTVAAHVLDLKGTWHTDTSATPLVRGQSLPQGAKIVAVPGQPGDSITLVRAQDLSRLQVACDATPTDPCRTPIAIQPAATPAPAAPSQIATLAHAAFALLMGSSPATASQYATTMTRSFPAEKLQEDVATITTNGTIIMPHSPGGIPVGSYTLLVAAVGTSTTSQLPASLAAGGEWQPIPFSQPGLFEFAVRDAQDHHIADILLLVAKEADAAPLKASFDSAKSSTDTWSGPNARRDQHLFLRAFLQSESNAR